MEKENYIATLIGCAFGDSLGMPVEGMKREQIKKHVGRITELLDPVIVKDADGQRIKEDEFGKLKAWTRELKKGMYTDDTILALALAESLVESGLDLEKAAIGQLNAYLAQPIIEGTKRSGAFGRTSILGLENIQKGIKATDSGVIGGPGNAPAMKMCPVGLYMQATGQYDQGLKFAEDVGKVTHLDPRSVVSGVVQAHAIYTLLEDPTKEEFLQSLINVSRKYEQSVTEEFPLSEAGSLTSKLEWVTKNSNVNDEIAYKTLHNSSVVMESYPFTIFMFQKYWDQPHQGLLETVNYGGDCDTTGAIYGSLSGAKNGMIFPEDWVSKVNNSENIIKLGEKLFGVKK